MLPPHRPPPVLPLLLLLFTLLGLSAAAPAPSNRRPSAPASSAARAVSTTAHNVCFSPYKCDEALDALRQKMEHANNRFGKFTDAERRCILEGSRALFERESNTACIKVSALDERILDMFGHCISRLSLYGPSAARQIHKRSWTPTLPNPPSASKPEPGSPVSLKSHADSDADADADADAATATAVVKDDAPSQHTALESDESAVRTTSYNTDCYGGQHWCCVFLGDEQSFSCFDWWCKDIDVNCT